jgi:hypothetical protein
MAATFAPDGLRERISAERRPRRLVWVRPSYRGLVVGAAAVLLAIVLVLPSSTPGSPSVSQAAVLALRGSTGPPLAARSGELGVTVGPVSFPSVLLGWRAVGERVDRLDGRRAVTMYYARGLRGPQVAYTVVARPALRQPGGSISTYQGTQLRVSSAGGRRVVSWLSQGDTCVLSGLGVSRPELLSLATWTLY